MTFAMTLDLEADIRIEGVYYRISIAIRIEGAHIKLFLY
jgi:hypothetical protein